MRREWCTPRLSALRFHFISLPQTSSSAPGLVWRCTSALEHQAQRLPEKKSIWSLRCFVGLSHSASVGNWVAEIEGDTAPEEHSPRMHWELLSSVQSQNAKAHLGANLLRIWDDGCFYDSEAYSVSNCVDLWSYPHKTSLVHFAVSLWAGRKMDYFDGWTATHACSPWRHCSSVNGVCQQLQQVFPSHLAMLLLVVPILPHCLVSKNTIILSCDDWTTRKSWARSLW